MQSSIISKVHETATSQEICHFALNYSKAKKRFAKMEKWQRNRARSDPKLKKNEGTKLLKFNSKNQSTEGSSKSNFEVQGRKLWMSKAKLKQEC